MKFLIALISICLLTNSYHAISQNLTLKIDKEQALNYHTTFPFEVTYIKDGKRHSTHSKEKRTKIKWSKLDIKVKNGSYLKSNGLIKIDGAKTNEEFGNIEISIHYKKSDLKLDTAINLNFAGLELLNFNAQDGKAITKWPRLHLMALVLGEMTNSEPNRQASNGKDGNKGKDGVNANVFMDLIKINQIEILKITCVNNDKSKNKTIYIDPKNAKAKLLAHGGNGSKGRNGEVITDEKGNKQVGKNGNKGRNGLDGHFDVYITKALFPYLKNISFSTSNSSSLTVKPIVKSESDEKYNTQGDGEVHVYLMD